MKLTKKDWLGLFALTGEEKRFVALLVALAALGLAGRYVYLHGKQVKPYAPPAGLPEQLKTAPRAPVAE